MRVLTENNVRISDLGRIDQPVLVLGGPYGNLEATEAVLTEATRRRIPSSHVICTGDIVAYSADPEATVDRMRAAGVNVVMGNVEESLAAGSEDCGCGYVEDSLCDILSVKWYGYAAERLSAEVKAWMGELPRCVRLQMNGRRLATVHGAVSAINRMIFASTPAAEKSAEIVLSGCDGVICGHSGLPFTQVIEGRLWHNAGVVGTPANDGTARVWYSVLSPRGSDIAVDYHPLTYDHVATANKMRERGLPMEYARTLATGLWHDCSFLPDEEASEQGKPLDLPSVVWRGEERD